jgi:hypothetical protein
MKRSNRFEDVLEECLELVLNRGETIESCLSRYPEHTDELRSLLEMALATKLATAVEPSVEFRERARAQFYRTLEEQPVREKPARFAWSWPALGGRWATTVGVAIAIVLMSGGTVAAAGRAMPGQPLYAVKQATEQARIALTPSAMDKSEFYAQLADRRVAEIVYLADRNDPNLVRQVTEQLDSCLDRISELTMAAWPMQGAGGYETFRQDTTVAGTGSPELAATAPTIPPLTATPAPAAVTSPVTITQSGQKSGPTTGETMRAADSNAYGAADTDRAKLSAILIAQSGSNPAKLKAALANASPEVRLALLKAIAVSETGYEKALQSLEVVQ